MSTEQTVWGMGRTLWMALNLLYKSAGKFVINVKFDTLRWQLGAPFSASLSSKDYYLGICKIPHLFFPLFRFHRIGIAITSRTPVYVSISWECTAPPPPLASMTYLSLHGVRVVSVFWHQKGISGWHRSHDPWQVTWPSDRSHDPCTVSGSIPLMLCVFDQDNPHLSSLSPLQKRLLFWQVHATWILDSPRLEK